MKKPIRILAGIAAVFMAVSFTACNSGGKEANSGDSTITWWIANSAAPNLKSYDEIVAMQKLQEKFEVDIQFIHPATAQEMEQFNVMAASGDFKDIVTYNWGGYTGGPVKAVKDGVIIGLDSYLEKNMPNLLGLMNGDAAINYLARCYDGSALPATPLPKRPSARRSERTGWIN